MKRKKLDSYFLRFFEGNLEDTVKKINDRYPNFENFEIELKQYHIGSEILFDVYGYKKYVKN